MPKRSKQESEQTKQSILRSAREALTTKGYEHLSLEGVAADSQVTRGAVYHHFGSKLGLFTAVATDLFREMGEAIDRWSRSGPSCGKDPWEALLLGTRGFLVESQTTEYQRIILTEAPAVLGVHQWQAIDDEYTTRTLVEVFGQFKEGHDTLVLAQAFSGAMNQLSRWIEMDGDVERAFDVLVLMFRSFLQTNVGSKEVEGQPNSVSP